MSGVGGHGPSPSRACLQRVTPSLGVCSYNRSIISPNINPAVHARAAAQPAITPRAGISAPPLPKHGVYPAEARP